MSKKKPEVTVAAPSYEDRSDKEYREFIASTEGDLLKLLVACMICQTPKAIPYEGPRNTLMSQHMRVLSKCESSTCNGENRQMRVLVSANGTRVNPIPVQA